MLHPILFSLAHLPHVCDYLSKGHALPFIALSDMISDADLDDLRHSKGKYAQVICDMCKFYRDWHVKSDGVYGNSAAC